MSAESDKDQSASTGGAARRSLAARIAALYGAMFAVFGIVMPFFNPWLSSRGLGVGEIAIIAAVPHLVRPFTTPLIAWLADRNDNHRSVLLSLAAIGCLGWIATARSSDFATLLLLQVLIGTTAAMMPLTESVAMGAVKTHGIEYGRVRVWGSVTFVGATLLGGFAIAKFGLDVVMVLIIPSAIAAVIAAYALPTRSSETELAAVRPGPSLSAAGRLVFKPELMLLLLVIGTVQSSHGMMYTYGSVHWQSLGLSPVLIGTLWATAVVAEILLFTLAGRLFKATRPTTLLLLGGVAAACRWLAMAFDPPLWSLFPLQAAHALSFGASHIGAMHALTRLAPEGQAGTIQAMASVATALSFATANACAGLIYAAHGALAYVPMAVLGTIAALAAHMLSRRIT